jgi:hypothetical protein
MKSAYVLLFFSSKSWIYIYLQDNDSHFHEALDHWRQLNLAPSFIQFADKADLLSASMPLLLHNWKDIYTLWIVAFESADDEGFRALLESVNISDNCQDLLIFFPAYYRRWLTT